MGLDGRMMDFPLSITHLLERGRALFPDVEVVTRRADKSLARSTYAATYGRAERLGRALARLGVKPGECVATLAWNHQQHLECYLGLPACGAVIHTLNLRLHPDELAFIANDAKDVVAIVDQSLLPLFEMFRSRVPSLREVLVVRAGDAPLPEGTHDYEALLAAEATTPHDDGMATPPGSPFRYGDERSAAMVCYTSGTTGSPKGVVYTHRSTVLHALVCSMSDMMGLRSEDVVLPVVPMFHAAAWGLPYTAFTNGAKLVMPGPHLDPTSLLDLMAGEGVTVAAGVPTIWNGILALLDEHPRRWNLSRMRTMIIGGAAAPPAMIQGFAERHGLDVCHAWGMTETNPLGTLARVTPAVRARGVEATFKAKTSQGVPAAFVELRHVDDSGGVLPWDAKAMGELEVRGPWVANSYLGDAGLDRFTKDGWFKTGDVVTIDPDGYLRITDRSKDVIKSGGEWISSVALENALMAHRAVLEAAVFAAPHPKWDERPVAAIVLRPGHEAGEADLRKHLEGHFTKFWLPDFFLFLESIPKTSTGKFLKKKLRDDHAKILEGKG